MRSLRSMFVERDAKLLHRIRTVLKPEPQVGRLLSQSRSENRLFFMIAVTRRLAALVSLTELNILLSLYPLSGLTSVTWPSTKKLVQSYHHTWNYDIKSIMAGCFSIFVFVCFILSFMLFTLCVNLPLDKLPKLPKTFFCEFRSWLFSTLVFVNVFMICHLEYALRLG